MSEYPTGIERIDGGAIRITWSDGQRRQYKPRELRDRCPCATCREKRKQPKPMLPVLSEADTAPLTIAGMKPIGSYAYGISFSDGHDTGIFTFDLLLETGTAE